MRSISLAAGTLDLTLVRRKGEGQADELAELRFMLARHALLEEIGAALLRTCVQRLRLPPPFTSGKEAIGERYAPRPGSRWSRVRRETGKEQRVQVPYSEGVANRAGPESCAVHREVLGEALTGVRVGQPLSRERISFRVPTSSDSRKATRSCALFASARPTRRGRRTWHACTLLAREPGDLHPDRRRLSWPGGPHREGEEP